MHIQYTFGESKFINIERHPLAILYSYCRFRFTWSQVLCVQLFRVIVVRRILKLYREETKIKFVCKRVSCAT